MRRKLFAIGTAAAGFYSVAVAATQSYPARPIRLIVPFEEGGTPGLVSRRPARGEGVQAAGFHTVALAETQSYPAHPIRLFVPFAPGGLDASSEQGSRLRDANVRESAAAAGIIAQASTTREAYPAHPIRLIVPFAPGGGADISGRMIAAKLSERFAQQVVVDNRPGAGGNLGTELAAKANPDGYTLLLSSSSYGANPSLYKLSYDPVTGFEPITLVSQQPFIFVINPTVQVKSVKELIAYAKANPGKLNYLSSGAGGIQHLATELFKSMAGVDIVHIPYRGGASGQTDLLANHVQIEFGTILSTLPLVKSGQLRALAVTTAVRSPALPETPTLEQAGVPGYAVSGWYAVFAPAHTPHLIVARLNREIVYLLQAPEVKQRLATEGSMVVASTPQELTAHIRREVGKWSKLVKDANIRLEASR